MNNFSTTARIFFIATLASLLASCGGGGSDSHGGPSRPQETVPWNVSVPSTAINARQQAALSAGTDMLKAGNVDGAIDALSALRAEVRGINPEVEAALGQGFAMRADLGLAAYRAAVARGTPSGSLSAADSALYTLTGSAPGVANDLAIRDGHVALQMMVPLNTPVRSLTQARQAEIGMIATVQFLRTVAQVMGGNSRRVSPAQIDAGIEARYDDTARAALNLSAQLLTATNPAVRSQVSDGLIVSLPNGLTALLADGDITPSELAGLLKMYDLR